MATVTTRYPVAEDGRDLARRTAGGVLVAVVAVPLVAFVVGAVQL